MKKQKIKINFNLNKLDEQKIKNLVNKGNSTGKDRRKIQHCINTITHRPKKHVQTRQDCIIKMIQKRC